MSEEKKEDDFAAVVQIIVAIISVCVAIYILG